MTGVYMCMCVCVCVCVCVSCGGLTATFRNQYNLGLIVCSTHVHIFIYQDAHVGTFYNEFLECNSTHMHTHTHTHTQVLGPKEAPSCLQNGHQNSFLKM